MILIGVVFIYLAIAKKIETSLFLPLGIGTILMNLPGSDAGSGILRVLFDYGVRDVEILPLVLFLGIGAMTDFSSLIQKPFYLILGLLCQSGIFISIFIARRLGFSINDAVSAGVIGAADGPTAIMVGSRMNTNYLGAVTVAAYSYMALVPLIQPFAIRMTVRKSEGQLGVTNSAAPITKRKRIVFPVAVIIVCGFISPQNISLIGFLMLGNLIRECGLLSEISSSLRTVVVDATTVFLALAISYNMKAENFFNKETAMILALGLMAFFFNIVTGIVLVKLYNLLAVLFKWNRINPIIASAGISAFPIASRIAQKEALRYKDGNIILADSLAVNCAGQICSAFVGGLLIRFCG